MARLSISSPESIGSSKISNTDNKKANKSPPNSNQNHPNDVSLDANLDSIRHKYIIQNKSLAKNNSLMLTKISNLETKVSELINENMSLRNKNSLKEIHNKQWLDGKLSEIENAVESRYEEIFRVFRSIRQREGLPEGISHKYTTSGPSTRRTTMLRSSTSEGRKSSRRQSMLINPETDPDVNFKNDVPIIHQPEISVDVDFTDYDMDPDYQETEEISGETSISHQSEVMDSPIVEEVVEMENIENIFTSSPQRRSPMKVKTGPIMPLVSLTPLKLDAPKANFDVFREIKPADNSPIRVSGSQNLSVSEAKKKIKHSAAPKSQTKSSPKSTESMPQSVNSQEDVAGRSARNRKSVNYALPSLRKKMRRESEKFIDAVVDGVELLGVKTQDGEIKQENVEAKDEEKENSLPIYIDNEVKRQKIEEKTKPTTRQPLANVTSKSNKMTKNKIISKLLEGEVKSREADSDDEDLSVFDFVGDATQLYVPTSKQRITKKFGSKREKRRHSMLI